MAIVPAILIILLVLFLFAACTALLVALQVWLCKRSLMLGLILPCGYFLFSLLPTALIALNVGIGPRNLLVLGLLFLAFNIPTVIFCCVWLHYRDRQSMEDDLKRMQIEDLE